MQRPLYGLAVDLTPEAVIGLAPYTPPSAVGVGPTASVRVAAPSGVAAFPTPRPRRLTQPRPDPARLVAAAVALGAMGMTIFMATSHSGPAPAIAAQTASAGNAAAAAQPALPVAAPSVAKPPAPAPEPTVKFNASAPARNHRPADPFESRSEPADGSLATTLERLREGIR